MSFEITQKLFSSLAGLERAITETKKNVQSGKSARPELLKRIECYEEVLHKQKILATALDGHLKDNNWEQVQRYVDLIRGSSLLIQLDSESIISEMAGVSASGEAKAYEN